MRAVVKAHKDLKGTKAFAFGSRKSQKVFKNFCNSCQNPLVVKLQPGTAYKKGKVKVTSATLSKKGAYTDKYFPAGFEKILSTTLNKSARLPLK